MSAFGSPGGSLGRARTRRPSVGGPFALLFAVSLLLFGLRSTDLVRGLATAGTQALVPVQRILAETGISSNRIVQAITEIERLRGENAELRATNDRLTLENVRLRERAVTAQQGTKLEGLQRTLPYSTIAAPVIARDPSGILRSIVIGAGTDQGVKAGDVVLSDLGVVGRVAEAGSNYAKVLLVTDSSSAVSALVQASRANGIVRGQYGDTMVMEWILQSDAVKPGDIVVTAGLAFGNELRSLYPKGLVLGTVTDVAKAEVAAYQRAIIRPAVDLRKLEYVLVIIAVP